MNRLARTLTNRLLVAKDFALGENRLLK